MSSNFLSQPSCLKVLEKLRWPDRIRCPRCDALNIHQFTNRLQMRCCLCRYDFNITVGTIFHKSHVPLPEWFKLIGLLWNNPRLTLDEIQSLCSIHHRTALRIKKLILEDFDRGGLAVGIAKAFNPKQPMATHAASGLYVASTRPGVGLAPVVVDEIEQILQERQCLLSGIQIYHELQDRGIQFYASKYGSVISWALRNDERFYQTKIEFKKRKIPVFWGLSKWQERGFEPAYQIDKEKTRPKRLVPRCSRRFCKSDSAIGIGKFRLCSMCSEEWILLLETFQKRESWKDEEFPEKAEALCTRYCAYEFGCGLTMVRRLDELFPSKPVVKNEAPHCQKSAKRLIEKRRDVDKPKEPSPALPCRFCGSARTKIRNHKTQLRFCLSCGRHFTPKQYRKANPANHPPKPKPCARCSRPGTCPVRQWWLCSSCLDAWIPISQSRVEGFVAKQSLQMGNWEEVFLEFTKEGVAAAV